MARYLTDDQVHEIAENLLGTCMESIAGMAESMEIDYTQMTDEDYQEIYDQIFECDGCGWWCETSEAHEIDGQQLCDNCMDEYEE